MLRKFLHKILVFVSLIFVFALLTSYLSIYISPRKLVFPAFLGLSYPYLLGINIVFALYWIYRKRWSALIPIFAIAVGWTHFSTYFATGFKSNEVITTHFNLMSYNVRYFNLYNWNKDPNTSDNMLNEVATNDVDIVCFQEFSAGKGLDTDKIKSTLKNMPYHYINHKGNLAVFSKYKITNKEEIDFRASSSASAFCADIQIGRDILRIYNCHLESNKFSNEDYEYINNIKKNAEEKNIEGAKNISKRLAEAFKARAYQAEILNKHITHSPYRTIICGDFNDSPISYAYHTIKGELNDSFIEKGAGPGTTYIGDFPSFRIDYILHSDNLECVSFERIKKKYSDHYPIIAGFRKDF